MAIAHSKFSLGLPTPDGESRFWEKSTAQTYACLIYTIIGKEAKSTATTIEKYLRDINLTDAQSLFEVVSTIESRCQEKNLIASVVGMMVENQQLCLASLRGGVFLVRGEKRGVLLTPKPTVQMIEGVFRQADVIVIYTEWVQEQIQLLLSKGFAFDQIQTLAQEFQHVIRKMDHSDAMAAAFIVSQKDGEEPIPSVSEPKPKRYLMVIKFVFKLLLEVLKSGTALILWLAGRVLRRFDRQTRKVQTATLAQQVLHPRKTYVGVHLPRKQVIWLILLVLATFLITVTLVVSHYKTSEKMKELAVKLSPYQQTLIELDQQAQIAPAQAYLGVQQLIQDLTTLESEYIEPQPAHKEVLKTLQQAQTLAQKLFESQAIEQLPIYDDLRTISPTFITSSFYSYDGRMLALDTQQQYLISYSLVEKTGKETILDSTNQFKVVTGNDKMFLALGKGVFSLSNVDDQLGANLLLETSDAVTNSQQIGSYDNFVYLLSAESRSIFRYELKSGKLVNRATWIGSSAGVPFADVTSMVVDGDIWVATKDGQIIRMRSGKTVEFNIEGLADKFESTLLMTTSLQSPYLYVLEPKKSRVVVLQKDTGAVVNQVQNRTLGSANNITYDESQKLVLVVSGSILYRMPL